MSRGIETMDTVFATGSRLTTIIVSVSAVLRPAPESIPMSSTLILGTAGVADGDAAAEADGAGGVITKSGSSDSTGGGVRLGPSASPSSTGSKTAEAASLA